MIGSRRAAGLALSKDRQIVCFMQQKAKDLSGYLHAVEVCLIMYFPTCV